MNVAKSCLLGGMGICMIYLTHFSFPDREREYDFTMKQKHTCYDTVYPF